MNMTASDIVYLLRSELISKKNKTTERFYTERVLNFRFLHEVGRNATTYNPEFKMYFKDITALASLYEIETLDVFVKASKRLSKAEEFIRRVNYKYDWIQPRVNDKGKILSVENKEELRERWLRLKEAILKDYKGDVVEHALVQTDNRLADDDTIMGAFLQYFHFGLLFPNIPTEHTPEWQSKRLIELSEYEDEKFEESITFCKDEDDVRKYDVKIQVLPESNTVIDSCKGYISVPKNDIFPRNIDLTIVFNREDIINQWHFELFRY